MGDDGASRAAVRARRPMMALRGDADTSAAAVHFRAAGEAIALAASDLPKGFSHGALAFSNAAETVEAWPSTLTTKCSSGPMPGTVVHTIHVWLVWMLQFVAT